MKEKKIEKVLNCQMTHEELQEKASELVQLLETMSEYEESKKSSARHYADLIENVKKKIERLSPVVSSGRIDRTVACTVCYHVPKAGLKTTIRQDTQEILGVEPMTEDELQDLFINAEEEEKRPAEPKMLPPPAEEPEDAEIVNDPETETETEENGK